MSGEAAKSRSACPYGAAALALPVAMLGAGLAAAGCGRRGSPYSPKHGAALLWCNYDLANRTATVSVAVHRSSSLNDFDAEVSLV